MEALCIQPVVEDGLIVDEDERGKKSGEEEGGAMEASSPAESTTDEDTEEDSEPEPPLVVRRKVSFADAFGLNLVSVKEFDNVEVTEGEVSPSPKGEATHPLQEFYVTCLFTVPSTPEELNQRLETQMVELESVELLPGTSTLRGIIRVINLCYTKFVYARMSLDHWSSYFDLLAEYLPGSSDLKTDRFTFKYTLVPPFGREGTRVEFCLRYETSVGTFWANNKEMNYVLFCHQKGHMKEFGLQGLEESDSYRSKRSCLKAKRRGSAKDKIKDTINPARLPADTDATLQTAEADRRNADSSEIQSLLHCEEHQRLADSMRTPHRATRSACVKDYSSQRRQQIPKAFSPDSDDGQKASQPLLAPSDKSARFFYRRRKKNPSEVLTYHQIPLLTLDWNSEKHQEGESSDIDDFWTEGRKLTLAGVLQKNIDDRPPGNDMWESLLNGTDEHTDKGASVGDVWQAFLNGPSCKDHSGVPESEWLQTAASVSPSNDKEPRNRRASSRPGFQEFQVGMGTPTTLHAHASAACQLLSAAREALLANVALNAEDHQPAVGCGRSTGDDNTVTQDASQRSQTKSVTDTPQEFSLKGATPVSEGSVDSSTKCHKHAIWERERDGIIGEAEAMGGDEPFTPHIADLVTSSGDWKTTDMTAVPQSPNARSVDRISQGARLHEGLSSSGGRDVTGSAHNATDDTLAFRETIRRGTKDGEGFVVATFRRGAEENIVTNCMENKVCTEEELFRPQEMCEISQSKGDKKQCEEFRLKQRSENPLQEDEGNQMGHAELHADEFNPKQIREEDSAVKSETGEHQTVEGICLSGITGLLRETNASSQMIPTVYSSDRTMVLQRDHDRIGPLPAENCSSSPEEVMKLRGSHSTEDGSDTMTPEEMMVKENLAQKDTSAELQHQRGVVETIEEHMSLIDRDERLNVGKEAVVELMDDVDDPRQERKTAAAELKEQDSPADVKRHQPVECKTLSEGTKEPITAEHTVAQEAIDSGLEDALIDRFADELVRGICELVLGGKTQDCNRDRNIVGGAGGSMAGGSDITHDGLVPFEQDFKSAFDSALFCFTDLSTDPNLGLCRGLEPSVVSQSHEQTQKERRPSLTTADRTHFPSEAQTHFNSSAHLSQDPTTTLAPRSRPSLTRSAPTLSTMKDQEGHYQIKKRSVTHQQSGRLMEECVGAQKESFNQSVPPSSPSSERLKESDSLVWWSVLYILSHITRLLICALLVVGYVVMVFLYDLPGFFALYVFSLCCCCYKWSRIQPTTNKRVAGQAES